ncbi:MAG: hypothetical protein KGI33_10490 [Thaumarchaeota archaeon]|nr:hypothetical protein [Nitrososphaerota archaeon]
MLSRTQRRFLTEPDSFSRRNSRQHRYTIRKMVARSLDDIELVIRNHNIVGLDIKSLKTRLESLVMLLGSGDISEDKKTSPDMQTGANPYVKANSAW